MMINWQRPTRHYAKRLEEPVVLVKTETLAKCRAGLSRHIRNTKDKDKQRQLMIIRDEIDFLIEVL